MTYLETIILALVLSIAVSGTFWVAPSHADVPAEIQQPNPVSVETTINRVQAHVADPIELVIKVIAPENVDVHFPETLTMLGPFDVIEVQDRFDIPTKLGRESRRKYELECISTGEQVIPPVEVGYVDRRNSQRVSGFVRSEAQSVTIVSSLEGAADPSQFRDIKNVVFLPEPPVRSYAWIAWGGVILVGVSSIIAFVLVRKRRSRYSPQDLALAALEQLSESDIFMAGDSERVYVSLTDIIRQFIDAEYQVSAPTLTTREFLEQLKDSQQLDELKRAELHDFLRAADLAKFAGLVAGGDALQFSLESAREFVTGCRSVPEPEQQISNVRHKLTTDREGEAK